MEHQTPAEVLLSKSKSCIYFDDIQMINETMIFPRVCYVLHKVYKHKGWVESNVLPNSPRTTRVNEASIV